MKLLPYRIQDTPHFLRNVKAVNEKREQEISPAPIIHCTFDIVKMFPNINNELGIRSCRDILDNRDIKFPSTESIIEGLIITLEENVAQFGSTVVKQHMGPHHSCSYADIAVDRAIDQIVMSNENKYVNNIGIWSRFRDDIYCAFASLTDS